METIRLNLVPVGATPVCHAAQYDEGRQIKLELYNGTAAYQIQAGDTFEINVRKPDNHVVETSITGTQGNTYLILETTEQMCAVPGINICKIKVKNSDNEIGTLIFNMMVQMDVLADGDPSQSVIEDLDAMIAAAIGNNYYNKQEVDEKVTILQDEVDDIVNGFSHLSGNFINGTISAVDGTLDTSVKYRVTSNDFFKFDSKTELTIKAGFRIMCLFWTDSSTYAHDGSGWQTGTYVMPANQLFKIIIARVTEVGTEIADIYEFVSKVSYPTITGISKFTVYNIYNDGSGDFSNIRACLDSIIDSSKYNQYIVNIFPGTYDIAALFSSEEISTGYGLIVPDYVTLKGIGDKHNIVLTATLSTQNNKWCPLNIYHVATLENLTIYSKNCRYTVHDDWQLRGTFINERFIKDCIFIGEYTYYGAVYGSGVKGGANWNFENCIFDGTKSNGNGASGACFLIHNNINIDHSNFVSFKNCRFKTTMTSSKYRRGLICGSMTNGSSNGSVYITLEGCDMNGISLYENSAADYGAGINFFVNGFGNINDNVMITNTDGIDYSTNVDLIRYG